MDYRVERDDEGEPSIEIPLRGRTLLANNMWNRNTAFTREEREALGISGMLPSQVRTLDEQAVRAYGHVMHEMGDALERYTSLAGLETRNATLYYRVLVDHLEEMLPIVYTPTVGEACQHYSSLFRRGRGLWITPDHRGRIANVLRNEDQLDVSLIVVTDNERILGLGDQGAGGMGIPVGKLDLYVAGAGIHPTKTLPISLDVGTDNQALLDDPYYLGYRERRLRGEAYDALVEEFVEAVRTVFPNALLQWEDFKKANALRLLDRYQGRLLSFNDDIQGTAGVALAGVVSASRVSGVPMEQQRVVILGAGAAGIGIGRILRAELARLGLEGDALTRGVAMLDSKGMLVEARSYGADYKREFAWPSRLVTAAGLDPDGDNDLLAVVTALQPTVLIGTSGVPNTFTEDVVRQMAETCRRPAIFPYSNPNSKAEAHPADLVKWTDGRALIASGSPFDPVPHGDKIIPVAQGNNVYVFPGVGLGALASRASKVVDSMFTAAAHAISEQIAPDAILRGELYPPLASLRSISRCVASAVGKHAMELGLADCPDEATLERRIDEMVWFPRYPKIRLPRS